MLFFEMAVMSDMNVRPPKEGRDSSEELTQDPPSQNEDGAPGRRTQEHRQECPCHGGGGKWRRFGRCAELWVADAKSATAEASAEEGHPPLTPIIPAPLATAALRVVPAPRFTTTSRIHAGAPTFLECGGLRQHDRMTNHGSRVTSHASLLRRAGSGPHNGKRTQEHRQECLCHDEIGGRLAVC